MEEEQVKDEERAQTGILGGFYADRLAAFIAAGSGTATEIWSPIFGMTRHDIQV